MADDTTQFDSPPLIDTHCHLDDSSFEKDYDAVIEDSLRAGVRGWINVGFEPSRWESSIELAKRTPGMAVMLGVHPSFADQWNDATCENLQVLIGISGAVAIGEIGLDFLRPTPAPAQQVTAFTAQLELAVRLGLPVVIHMRESESAMLNLLTHWSSLPRLLFHSYDGGPKFTDFILETGSYVGVGGLATRTSSDRLRHELLRIPMNKILLETDSPYLVPARQRGRRNTPANVRSVATFLSGLKSEDERKIAHITTQNAYLFFGRLKIA